MDISNNKVIPIGVLTLLFIFSSMRNPGFAASSPTSVADGKSAGATSAAVGMSAYGTPGALKNNVTMPLTSGTTMMKTLDGAKSFDATMSAPSSNRFLEIFMQPGPSGDLSVVTIGQDTDANGTLDYSFNIGVPVSGVCANGFISCTPGTWNNCKPYKWVSTGGKVSFVEDVLTDTDLGGCYCINSSCGSRLVWNNAGIVLQDLGGGVVGALTAENGSTMVTDVRSDLVSIRYYGRVVSNTPNTATTPSTSAAVSSPAAQAYYNDSARLNADVSNISTTQSSNPNSMYYQIVNSVATGGAASLKQCTIRVDGSLISVPDASFTDSGTKSMSTDELLYGRVKKSDNVLNFEVVDTGGSGYPSDAYKNTGNPGGDGWYTLSTLTLPPETGNYQSKITSAYFALSNFSGCNSASFSIDAVTQGFDTPVRSTLACTDHGVQGISFDWTYTVVYSHDTYTNSISDQCSSIVNADPSCKLKEETIDGVVTMINFNPTQLRPLPSCKTFVGQAGDMQVCKDWWVKQRSYVCNQNATWDLSAAKERFNSINTTANLNGNTLGFTDKTLGPGGWTTSPSSITLPTGDTFSECSKSCKVKRTRTEDTQVAVSGIPSMRRNDQNTFDYFYLPCADDVTCPSEPGDVVVTGCSCINEFGQAASVMQLMRQGGGDSICSDGVPKQL